MFIKQLLNMNLGVQCALMVKVHVRVFAVIVQFYFLLLAQHERQMKLPHSVCYTSHYGTYFTCMHCLSGIFVAR